MINAGTSTSGPMTPANASPEFKPKTAIETAIANSKLLPAAVKDIAAFLSFSCFKLDYRAFINVCSCNNLFKRLPSLYGRFNFNRPGQMQRPERPRLPMRRVPTARPAPGRYRADAPARCSSSALQSLFVWKDGQYARTAQCPERRFGLPADMGDPFRSGLP